MTLSRDIINPKFPRNISDLKFEGHADVKIPMGRLAVREGERKIVQCDPFYEVSADTWAPRSAHGTPAEQNEHISASVEPVWVDSETRFDVPYINMAGNQKYQITTLAGNVVADVKESDVFEQAAKSPSEGDTIIKSIFTPGKIQAVSRSQLNGILTNQNGVNFDGTPMDFQNFNPSDAIGMRVGTVLGDGAGAGMVRVRFDVV